MSDNKYVDYTEVGLRIGNRRRKMGLKQSEVNEMIKFSDKYLSHVESGKNIPSIDALMKICAVLDTTPDHLLLGAIRSDSDDEIIREKVKMIRGKNKVSMLSEFIELLARQNI